MAGNLIEPNYNYQYVTVTSTTNTGKIISSDRFDSSKPFESGTERDHY